MLCIYGIEALILSILMLMSIYVYLMLNHQFTIFASITSYLFAVYYVGKSIIIYIKSKKEYIQKQNDIKEIVKQEKPKKKETSKKGKK